MWIDWHAVEICDKVRNIVVGLRYKIFATSSSLAAWPSVNGYFFSFRSGYISHWYNQIWTRRLDPITSGRPRCISFLKSGWRMYCGLSYLDLNTVSLYHGARQQVWDRGGRWGFAQFSTEQSRCSEKMYRLKAEFSLGPRTEPDVLCPSVFSLSLSPSFPLSLYWPFMFSWTGYFPCVQPLPVPR